MPAVILFLTLMFLKWVDCITTYIGVTAFGVAVEKNPLAYYAMSHVGVLPFMLITMLMFSGVLTYTLGVALKYPKRAYRTVLLVFGICNLMYLVVAVNNLYQIYKGFFA